MHDIRADELEAAQRVVYAAMAPTPQYAWPLLRERLGAEVWVKHENHTPLGAFKLRGGLVYLDALAQREPGCPGVISATRGNHGQSVAFAARQQGLPVTIVVPHGNSVEKNAAMRALGAELVEQGDDFQQAREACGADSRVERKPALRAFVPPRPGLWASRATGSSSSARFGLRSCSCR
jgi:threonine dehydratase